jgi:hypothetical protein
LLGLILRGCKKVVPTQLRNVVSHGQLTDVTKSLVRGFIFGVELIILKKMFIVVDAHFQVGKVLALAFRDLHLWVSFFLTLLFLVESFIKEFILVINDEVVGAVSKRYHRSVWQAPTKAPSHSYSKSKLVILRSKLGDINHLWIH